MREAILVALETALRTVLPDPACRVCRGGPGLIPEGSVPVLNLIDGTEEPANAGVLTSRNQPLRLRMLPVIEGFVRGDEAVLPAEINALYAKVQKAIWTSDAVWQAIGTPGTLDLHRFEAQDLESARADRFALTLSIVYTLRF